MISLKTHPAISRAMGGAAVGAVLATLGPIASTQAPPPSPRAFTYLAPGYTQALVGVADVGVFAEDQTVAKVFGGVAFAPDGDVWVADCTFTNTKLRRIDVATALTPVRNSTPSLRSISEPVQTEGGCGLTNHPNGSMYSNAAEGLYQLDVNTGAVIAGPLGQSGNSLGIAVDPVTSHLVYPGADCHDRLVASPTTCTLWDFDPASGVTTPFAMFPHIDVPFVDGVYFTPTGSHLFVTNRIAEEVETTVGLVEVNQLTVVTRPTGPVTLPGTAQIVQHLPMIVEPDGVAFHSVEQFVVTNNEASGTMSRFDFPGGDYSLPPAAYSEIQPVDGGGDPVGPPLRVYGTTFASGGHRGDLTQVGADGCIYATQGRNFDPTLFGTRFDDGVETSEDSVVRICAENGGGFEPPPGVRHENRGRIAGSVYLDVNGNHSIDAADSFLAGVPVDLGGTVTRSAASTAGPVPAYSFAELGPGGYSVSVPSTFAGYALSATTPSGIAATITPAGEQITGVDFLYEAGRLTGSVYLDTNDSGVIDEGDAFLSGVPVQLAGAGSASSLSSGGPAPAYSFPGLAGGDYQVSVPPTFGGYRLDSITPARRTLAAGGVVSQVDFLYVRGKVSGFAFVDTNNNGVMDQGEPPLANVTITGPGGANRSTAADGSYSYVGLAAGSFDVRASSPVSGYVLSTASPLQVTVGEGASVEHVDFGYQAPTPPPAAFVTYTQGGWGAPPNGNNPGMVLQTNFNTVYNTCPSKTASPTTTATSCVTIGIVGETGRFFLRFTTSTAVMNFLPAGGAPKALKASANNPTSSAAGVFAGQVLAVQLAVNFSNAGVITPGLASLKVASGHPLAGQTVSQVLAIANRVLGGDLSVLPPGMSIAALNDAMARINENFDNGTTNNGFLVP